MKNIIVYGRKMDNSGGVESYIYNIYSTIDRSIFRTTLIIPDLDERNSPGMEKYEKIFDEIKYIECHTKSVKNNILQLYKILRKNKDSIFHIHASNGFHSINGLVAKFAGIKKVVYHSHSAAGIENLAVKVGRVIFRFTGDHFLACTQNAGSYMFGKKIPDKENFDIVKNAIDTHKFSFNELKRHQFRKEQDIGDEQIVLGYVGRLSAEKNVDFLIDVFIKLNHSNKKYHLLIIGDGNEKENLEKTCENKNVRDKVSFLGERSDIDFVMNGLDILLLPSEFEALGIVLIEAQCTGLQCIASKNVNRETNITNLIRFLPLNKYTWIEYVSQCNGHYKRVSQKKHIDQAGYGIQSATIHIQDLFLKI